MQQKKSGKTFNKKRTAKIQQRENGKKIIREERCLSKWKYSEKEPKSVPKK